MMDNKDKSAADPNKVDAIKLSLMLSDLRLPTINQLWQSFAKRADAEGWTAARFLAALAEHELAERDRRRIERHLREAKLLPGKSLDSFDFNAVPMISKAQVSALAAGDAWLTQGANCLVFGPPGAGKSHLASAIGFALVENGYRVFFTRTTDLVQRMQVARPPLGALREHFGQAFDRLALPGANLVRMDLILRGDLLKRLLTPKRLQRHLCLQVPRKSASFAAHRHSSVTRWNTPYRPVRFSGATSCLSGHVRICAGGAGQPASLPRS